jgi:hypothetical protein
MILDKNLVQVTPEQMVEIRKAIKANAREDVRQTRKGIHSTNLFWMYDTQTKTVKKCHKRSTGRKTDDIYAASVVGALVIQGKTGADAALPISDTLLELVELKLCYRSLGECWVSSEILTDKKVLSYTNLEYTVYVGENKFTSKKSLKSSICASFEISEDGNLASKNRRTFLCIRDDDNDAVIEVVELSGDKVHELLKVRCQGRKTKTAFKPKITFNQFLEQGSVFHGLIPSVGMDRWSEGLIKKAAKKHMTRRARLINKLPELQKAKRLKRDRDNRRKAA